MRALIAVVLTFIFASTAIAQGADFNVYMMKAMTKLKNDGRLHLGYHKSYWYTRNLDYGKEKGAIKAKDKDIPYTMCNAAVTETIVEAVNEYAKEHPDWSPQSTIPTKHWNDGGFTNLQTHLFSHELRDYEPLDQFKEERAKEVPPYIFAAARNFDSSESMAKAFETLGIGKRVRFEEAKPGDVISISRDDDYSDGRTSGNGHSVVFLAYIDNKLELTTTYGANVRGFRYFSSQGDQATGGLGEKSGYFEGFCPLRKDYQLKAKSTGMPGCGDRVVSPQRLATTPYEKNDGEKTDCCIIKSGTYGPKVGRLYSPVDWSYVSRIPKLEADYQAVKKRIKEWYDNRGRASQSVALMARGASALASLPEVKSFIVATQNQIGIDLSAINNNNERPNVSVQQAQAIRRLAPQQVILEANKTVTVSEKKRIDREVDAVGLAALARLSESEKVGVPNTRLDGVIR